jgi:putative nucleotidyltransferase with HDIG domain
MSPTRAEAEALLEEFTQSEALRRHARGVEQAMRAYAGFYGLEDPVEIEKWGIVGLLHDFDYEQNPTVETHVHVGCRILRERGIPEEIVTAIASHADYMGIPRDTPLKKALYGCDELVGFIGAAVKVRPTKKVADLPVESVTKKLKDKAFARSVDRACVKVRPTKKVADQPVESVTKKLKDKAFARSVDRAYVYGGAEAVGRPLDEHVGFLIEALKPIADEIGL